MRRIAGVSLIVIGTALVVFAARSAWRATEMAQFVAEIGAAMGESIDPQVWASRWRSNAIAMGLVGSGGALAGAGFLARWWFAPAFLGLGSGSAAGILAALRLSGGVMFAFEAGVSVIASLIVLTVFCGWRVLASYRRTSAVAI